MMADGSAGPIGPDSIVLDPEAVAAVLDPVADGRFPDDVSSASVAAVLRPTGNGAAVLLIQRATKHSDPWSGQMAFPGGRTDPGDRSILDTARRETREELALDLDAAGASPLGSLITLDGGRAVRRPTLVGASVFWLDADPGPLRPNHEVADALWVPLSFMANPDRHITYRYPGNGMEFPGIELDRPGQVLWGLTLRFVADLFERLGEPFIRLPAMDPTGPRGPGLQRPAGN